MKLEKYHPAVKTIIDLLETNDCWYETFEHEPVRTSEEAVKTRIGYILNQGAKAIIVRAKTRGGEKKFVMVVMPADKKLNTQSLKNILNEKAIVVFDQILTCT